MSVLMLARSGHFVYFTHTHKYIDAMKTFRKHKHNEERKESRADGILRWVLPVMLKWNEHELRQNSLHMLHLVYNWPLLQAQVNQEVNARIMSNMYRRSASKKYATSLKKHCHFFPLLVREKGISAGRDYLKQNPVTSPYACKDSECDSVWHRSIKSP